MKVREEHYKSDYSNKLVSVGIVVETKQGSNSFYIGAGEPEDMIFDRDLSDVFNIPKLIELAYQAGKNGEDFEKVTEEILD